MIRFPRLIGRPAALAAGLLLAGAAAALADNQAVIDLTGVQLRNGVNQSRNSGTDLIDPGFGYRVHIDGTVRGSGVLLGVLFPTDTPLAQALETLAPGSSEFLNSELYNPSGTLPVEVVNQVFAGQTTIIGVTVTYSATFSGGINAAGQSYFSITNVTLSPASLVGYLTMTSGSATTTRIPAITGDMNFDGVVDNSDIDAFVLALLDQAAYATLYGYDVLYAGDINRDGVMDNSDIDSFVALLLQ